MSLLPSWSRRADWVAGIVLPADDAAATLGDFDDDGDLDLVVTCFMESILYFENTGLVSSSPAWTRNDDYFLVSGWEVGPPSAVDVDGDGDPRYRRGTPAPECRPGLLQEQRDAD